MTCLETTNVRLKLLRISDDNVAKTDGAIECESNDFNGINKQHSEVYAVFLRKKLLFS